VIKARIVKFKAGGIGAEVGAARAHLRYLQRDGVSTENEAGQLYNATQDEIDDKEFRKRSDGDRHQFRFIVAPEDATELADMKPFVRDLMEAMELDLETRLDWVAVDHFNTEHPHSHIVLRGKDELGKDLVIAREYISKGMRQRASEILTLELGPQTVREVVEKFRRQVDQDRFTDLDRELVREVKNGSITKTPKAATSIDRFKQGMRMGRLRHLERLGLAKETRNGEWKLSSKLEATLRRAGERGDIIKTMHRGMKQAGLEVSVAEYTIYDPRDPHARTVIGQIIDRGLQDELNDGHYIVVDASDGRVHHIALDPKQDMDDLPIGAIVEIHPALDKWTPSDRVIKDIAGWNSGLYSPSLHAAHDPSASPEFIQAHVRRLEALRRLNIVRRFADGSWEIPDNFAERVKTLANKQARYPGQVVLLSSFSLERQIGALGATWLDRQLVAKESLDLRGDLFGRSAGKALIRRQQYLIENNLADRDRGVTRYQRNLLRTLRRRELTAAGERLATEMKLEFRKVRGGERIEGVYKQPVHLASGKFAVVANSKGFTLVPWRAVLERKRGGVVSGTMHGSTVSFEIGKKRGIGVV
jgi:type IV secretory pathway VirD2 relaxase